MTAIHQRHLVMICRHLDAMFDEIMEPYLGQPLTRELFFAIEREMDAFEAGFVALATHLGSSGTWPDVYTGDHPRPALPEQVKQAFADTAEQDALLDLALQDELDRILDTQIDDDFDDLDDDELIDFLFGGDGDGDETIH